MKLIQDNILIPEPGDFGLYKPIGIKFTLLNISQISTLKDSIINMGEEYIEIIIKGEGRQLPPLNSPIDIKLNDQITYKQCKFINYYINEDNEIIFTLKWMN